MLTASRRRSKATKMKILFVCTGNICRSPTAEGVFQYLLTDMGLDRAVTADSAGTHGYHVGEAPDPRTVETAAKRGYDLSAQKARRVRTDDFEKFDLILAMDRGHLSYLQAMQPHGSKAEVRLFLDFHPSKDLKDVPDPYYGGGRGFEDVLDMVEAASIELIGHLKARMNPAP